MRPIALLLALVISTQLLAQDPAGGGQVALRAEQWARDSELAASLASNGRLLYDTEANKKSWGQYCADSQRQSNQGEFRSAIRAASKALYLGERDSNVSARAYAMRDLAYAYSLAGDLERAREWADRALPAARAVSNPNVNVGNELVSPVEKVLGDIAARRGEHAAALGHYRSALDAASMFSDQKAAIRVAIGATELRAGRPAKAREILTSEAGSSDPALAAIARRGLGEVALEERLFEQARTSFAQVIESAQARKSEYHEMWGHYGLARAHAGAGDTQAAQAAFDRAVRLAEGLRGEFRVAEFRSGFFGDVQAIFDQAVGQAAAAGDAVRALRLSEQSRARSALDQQRARTRSARELASTTRATDPAVVAGALPDGTVVVAYHVLSERSVAWTVRRSGIEMKRLQIGERALQASIGRMRAHVTAMRPAAQEARDLHTQLIEPLALRPGELVVFVPHRALHFAALHALGDANGPLINRHAVAYGLSLTAVGQSLSQPLQSRGGVLALGNPDLGDPAHDLPAAEEEVRTVAQLAGGTPLVRKDASAAHFRAAAPGAGLIHVAAHATVDDVDPLHSTIRLAGGNVEAREIYDMDLRTAGLVTLSACSSGLGRVKGGDEFFGFKRSFFVAGARSLLVSLWPVGDESTARLMAAFYRHRGQKSAAEALRLAQLELAGDPRDAAPLLWAPFMLVGDWR